MKYKTEAEVEVDYPRYFFHEVEHTSKHLTFMSRQTVINELSWKALKMKLNSFDRSWADGL